MIRKKNIILVLMCYFFTMHLIDNFNLNVSAILCYYWDKNTQSKYSARAAYYSRINLIICLKFPTLNIREEKDSL